MTTTASRTVPSPADKRDLILRFFPALLPTLNHDTGDWDAPSMTDRDVIHTITTHQRQGGPIERRCNCKATRTCTHLLLVHELTGGEMIHGEKLHYTYDQRALEAKYAHVLRYPGVATEYYPANEW